MITDQPMNPIFLTPQQMYPVCTLYYSALYITLHSPVDNGAKQLVSSNGQLELVGAHQVLGVVLEQQLLLHVRAQQRHLVEQLVLAHHQGSLPVVVLVPNHKDSKLSPVTGLALSTLKQE